METSIAQVFISQPSAFCFSVNTNDNFYLKFFYLLTFLIGTIAFIMFVVFTLYAFWNIEVIMNKILSRSTHSFQRMIFLSCTALIASMLIVVTGSLCIVIICILFKFSYTNTEVLLGLLCMCCHSTVDCFTLIAFVKPYRYYFMEKVFRRKTKRSTSVISNIATITLCPEKEYFTKL